MKLEPRYNDNQCVIHSPLFCSTKCTSMYTNENCQQVTYALLPTSHLSILFSLAPTEQWTRDLISSTDLSRVKHSAWKVISTANIRTWRNNSRGLSQYWLIDVWGIFFKHVIILVLKAAAGDNTAGTRPKFPEINKQTQCQPELWVTCSH